MGANGRLVDAPERLVGTNERAVETNRSFRETNEEFAGTHRRPVEANGRLDHTHEPPVQTNGTSVEAVERFYREALARDHADDCAKGEGDVKSPASWSNAERQKERTFSFLTRGSDKKSFLSHSPNRVPNHAIQRDQFIVGATSSEWLPVPF